MSSAASVSSAASSSGGAGGSSVSRSATAPVAMKRKEDKEERDKRKSHVGAYRQGILKKLNADKARNLLHKKEDLLCPVQFSNSLPPPPVDPKLQAFPVDEDAAQAYDLLYGVSSEQGHLYQLHTTLDNGVVVDLADPENYMAPRSSQRPPLDAIDAEITSEKYAKQAARKRETGNKFSNVEWMMRSSLMHLDLFNSVYKHIDAATAADMSAQEKRSQLKKAYEGTTRQQRIEESFRAVGPDMPLRHPSKPNVSAVAAWEVLPSTAHWASNYTLASFDVDPGDAPSLSGRQDLLQHAAVKRARVELGLLRAAGVATAEDLVQDAAAGGAAGRPVNVAEGTVKVHYMLPEPEHAEKTVREALQQKKRAEAAEEAGDEEGRAAAVVPSVGLRAVRDYHMVVERAEPQKGNEQFVLFWDNDAGIVTFAPVKSTAQLTSLQLRKGEENLVQQKGLSVNTAGRKLTAEEKEALILAQAQLAMDSVEAANVREVMLTKRQERHEAARRRKEEAAAAAASSSSASASSGSSGGYGASSFGGGAHQERGGAAGGEGSGRLSGGKRGHAEASADFSGDEEE